MNHIRDKLPDMKARLNTLMGQAQQELNSFGDAAVFGDKNQVWLYVAVVASRIIEYTLARGLDPPINDSIRSGLRVINRGDQSRYLYQGTLRRRTDILYL